MCMRPDEQLEASAKFLLRLTESEAPFSRVLHDYAVRALNGGSPAEQRDAIAALAKQALALAPAVGGDSEDRVAAGVAELHADDDFLEFDLVVAQAIAAGVACVAAGIDTFPDQPWLPVIEEISTCLDYCAPYVFAHMSRLVNLEMTEYEQCMLRALQALCAWILAMLSRVVGHEHISNPTSLWEWVSGDLLWALVLAKGILTVPDEWEQDFLPLPHELCLLQKAVLSSVLGLAGPPAAFFGQEPEALSTIEECAALSARHREKLAQAVLACRLLSTVVCATARLVEEDARLLLQLVIFLKECMSDTHNTSLNLAVDLRDCGLQLWCLLARAPGLLPGTPTLQFLRSTADLAFFAPPPRQVLAGFVSATLASNPGQQHKVLAALCVLVANAGASLEETPLATNIYDLPQDEQRVIAEQCQRWRGPAKRESLFGQSILEVEGLPPTPPEPVHTEGLETCDDVGRSNVLWALLCSAPQEFCCAMDGQLMMDPVQTPQGLVFERARLAQALMGSVPGRCPITDEVLLLEDCVRLPELRARILRWVRTQPRQRQEPA